jgi:hypothetical protein
MVGKTSVSAVAKYREARRAAGVSDADLASGKAALIGLDRPDEVCAVHDSRLVDEVNRHVNFVAESTWERVANRMFGVEEPIGIRRDWTWRCFKAERPRALGGFRSSRYRSIDDWDRRYVFEDGGPCISLRLAKRVPTGVVSLKDCGLVNFWEYSPLSLHPLIGDRRGVPVSYQLELTIAHELAHALHVASRVRAYHYGASDPLVKMVTDLGREWVAKGNYLTVSQMADVRTGGHESQWQALYHQMRSVVDIGSGGPFGELSGLEVLEWAPSAKAGIRLRPDLIQVAGTQTAELPLCKHCGKEPVGKSRSDGRGGRVSKFCSSKCRTAHSRAKAKERCGSDAGNG